MVDSATGLASLQAYFPSLSDTQETQFLALGALYTDWNSKINVISRKDIDNLYVHHVLHSLALRAFIRFQPGTRVVDVGTGGGFPGIPLAIFYPEVEFVLSDAIGKKIKVVQAVADELGLKNVTALNAHSQSIKGQFDFITGRGVTALNAFLPQVRHLIGKVQINSIPNGLLYLRGPLKPEEEISKMADLQPLAQWFSEPFFADKWLLYLPMG